MPPPTIALLLFAILCPGCISATRRLEVSSVKEIVVGQTTPTDIERAFGPPHERINTAGGLTIARYFFHEVHKSTDTSWHVRREYPGDILFRTLTLGYGANKTVERKLHDESLTPVYRTNAWYFVGPILTPESVSFITRNGTTERELIRRLGEPTGRSFNPHGQNMLFWLHGRGRETWFSSLEARKLVVILGNNSVVHDYILVEQPMLNEESRFTLQ